jgi:hypothetical protein
LRIKSSNGDNARLNEKRWGREQWRRWRGNGEKKVRFGSSGAMGEKKVRRGKEYERIR